jgi:raffinose/stachyose/melibiose transport system permease protein
MFPINVAILPVYFVLRQIEQIGIPMIDTLWGVVLVQIAFQLSGNIMILQGFFTAVPSELQDAAYMDGCSHFDFYWRIMLPLAKPSLTAVGSLVMIASWNDLLVPLIILNSNQLWTLPLGTMQFQGQYGQDLALVSAFVAISAIPTILFYFIAEKQIVAGLTAGAVKG